MLIVGLAGKKQSGKDSIGDYLTYKFGMGAKKFWFATKLKEDLIQRYGLTREQCYGTNEQKNSITKYRWEEMPGAKLVNVYGHTFLKGKCGLMTAREFMQFYGTDICRAINNNIWVDACMYDIKNSYQPLSIVCDMRYPNEVEAVHKAGGIVVRLTRDVGAGDTHSSETALDNYDEFDYIVDNQEMSVAEQNEILWAIVSKHR